MTQEIIKSIKQAEEQAQAVKDSAVAQAESLIKQAERAAIKEGETMEQVCQAFKNSQLKDAEKLAQQRYEQSLEEQRAKSATECSKILENSESYVGLIVGRVIRGDR
jgi:vacuolar-type H+-ATPase subunit H